MAYPWWWPPEPAPDIRRTDIRRTDSPTLSIIEREFCSDYRSDREVFRGQLVEFINVNGGADQGTALLPLIAPFSPKSG